MVFVNFRLFSWNCVYALSPLSTSRGEGQKKVEKPEIEIERDRLLIAPVATDKEAKQSMSVRAPANWE
jgi:hypothetical protein